MTQARVMHYLNQFFAGVGSEDKADEPLGFSEKALGPGNRLQVLLGDSARIIITAYCGDNYFNENTNQVLADILQAAKNHKIDIVVAGPAIAAGRYGFACNEVCHHLASSAGLYGVTSMYQENPGVAGYQQYKDRKVFLLPMSASLKEMEDALSRVAKFVSKLASGSPIGLAAEEGYLPRGIRLDVDADEIGAARAIDMLQSKLAGRPFETEIAYETFEEVPIPPPIKNIKEATIAFVSTTGLTLAGNPYGFKMFRNTKFEKYDIGNMNSMKDGGWEVLHGGYNNSFMLENSNYGVPLDAARLLEKEGAFSKLYPYFYGTTGVEGVLSAMEDIGQKIAADMKAEGVDAVMLVST